MEKIEQYIKNNKWAQKFPVGDTVARFMLENNSISKGYGVDITKRLQGVAVGNAAATQPTKKTKQKQYKLNY